MALEAIQTAEMAILIGGGAWLVWQFKDVIFGGLKLTSEVGEKVGGVIDKTAEVYGDAWESTPAITKAGRAVSTEIFGSKEEAESAGKEFMNELRKEKNEGNAFIGVLEEVDKFFGGDGLGEPKYKPEVEDLHDKEEWLKPINGSFGDQTEPLLLKQRCWYGATLRNNRKTIRAWNVTAHRDGYSDIPALTGNLTGFQASVEKQMTDIVKGYEDYYNHPKTPYIRDKDNRAVDIAERFQEPSWGTYGHRYLDFDTARNKLLWNDPDASSYINVFERAVWENEEPVGWKGRVYYPKMTGQKVYIGLAGALDDTYPKWRDEWKVDKETTRIHMSEALNSLEIPDTYFDLTTAKVKNTSENLFIKYYGLGYEFMGGSIHFKTTPNTSREDTEAMKTATEQVQETAKKIGKKISKIF